ncbi:hypothetical protein ACFQU9_19500 [Actinomadura namibiensis]|uniref:Uncharacterized protein n=1 Tax=Actinomadura namibiensis TaxID=182080 RepID=A0A7W3LRK7_ACTNM|nr:hypothetical protein [Actinomadura namibiensis]MBA8952905.1 hypothetical protein [Actinomadura namibiensis]
MARAVAALGVVVPGTVLMTSWWVDGGPPERPPDRHVRVSSTTGPPPEGSTPRFTAFASARRPLTGAPGELSSPNHRLRRWSDATSTRVPLTFR